MNENTRAFFDRHAAWWDSYEVQGIGGIIEEILDRIRVSACDSVLDVGCGTGILLPHLERRGVRDIRAVDLSAEMVKEYLKKYPGRAVTAGDYEAPGLFGPKSFTKILIYNAFPHFERRELVFANSYNYLKPGGGLYIAHSMGRAELDRHHKAAGEEVAGHMLYSNVGFRELYAEAGFTDIVVDDGGRFFSRGLKPLPAAWR